MKGQGTAWYRCTVSNCDHNCYWDGSRKQPHPTECPLGIRRASWEPYYGGGKNGD